MAHHERLGKSRALIQLAGIRVHWHHHRPCLQLRVPLASQVLLQAFQMEVHQATEALRCAHPFLVTLATPHCHASVNSRTRSTTWTRLLSQLFPSQRKSQSLHTLSIPHWQNTASRRTRNRTFNQSNSTAISNLSHCISRQTSTAPTRSRLESLSKTAPHLVFLLNRGASRKRKHIPFKLTQTTPLSVISAPPVASEYRPSSTSSFLSRLSTFKLTTYANKPAAIDAVAAAKCGWVNEGKDRLVCGICSVSWVIANKDGMSRETGMYWGDHGKILLTEPLAATLVEKQRISLVQMHKDGCPWKSKQCEGKVLRSAFLKPLTCFLSSARFYLLCTSPNSVGHE